MPRLIDQLRNKLAERLNWDTFTKEIGQGMETLPTPMTVLTPGTIGKFSKLLDLNKQYTKFFYKNLSPEITDAIAFIKTRYPKSFNRVRSIQPLEGNIHAGGMEPITKTLFINPEVSKYNDKVGILDTLGHEIGHLVTRERYPKIAKDPKVGDLYSKVFRRTPLRNIPLLKELYWNAVDELYKHPFETIPDKIGGLMNKQYSKFLEMSK